MKIGKGSTAGCSFWGVTIKASVEELTTILLKPYCEVENHIEWVVTTDEDRPVCIYRREDAPVMFSEKIIWHLGGYSEQPTLEIKGEIEARLDTIRNDAKFSWLDVFSVYSI